MGKYAIRIMSWILTSMCVMVVNAALERNPEAPELTPEISQQLLKSELLPSEEYIYRHVRHFKEQKKQEEAKQHEEKAFSNDRTLLIFLDDTEIATNTPAIVTQLALALYQKAGPILVTGSLLAHAFSHAVVWDNPTELQLFLEKFRRLFDATEWKLYRNDAFFLLIPIHDIETGGVSLNDFNLSLLSPLPFAVTENKNGLRYYFDDDNKKEYNYFLEQSHRARRARAESLLGLPHEHEYDIGEQFLALFPKLLIPIGALPSGERLQNVEHNTSYTIYQNGHGGYNASIAGLSTKEDNAGNPAQFKRLLDRLYTEIMHERLRVKLFVYNTCYGAGSTAAQVFGDMKSEVGATTYPFGIVTGATGDAPAVVGEIKDIARSETRYDAFVQASKKYEKYDVSYAAVLGNLFAIIKRGFEAETPKTMGSIPQIRPPYVPAWFPVTEVNKAVIRIGDVMSATRREQLTVNKYKNSTTGMEENPTAILLATEEIKFPLIMGKSIDAPVPLISLLPGRAEHKLKLVKYEAYMPKVKDLIPHVRYAEKKEFDIDELILTDSNGDERSFFGVTASIEEDECDIGGFDADDNHVWFFSNTGEHVLQAIANRDINELAKALSVPGRVTGYRGEYGNQGDKPVLRVLAMGEGEDKLAMLRTLIAAKESIEATDKSDESPLHFVCQNGMVHALAVLLDNNVNVNAIDQRGNTALYNVLHSRTPVENQRALVKLLLRYGANPDIKNESHQSARSLDPGTIQSIQAELDDEGRQ